MNEPTTRPPTVRTGWLLPVLLAATSALAVLFGMLYFARPGELGVVRVVVEEPGDGKGAAAGQGRRAASVSVVIGEAPVEQTDTVSPRRAYTGTVYYRVPFALPPNLRLTSKNRQYDVLKQDEIGFTWVARPLAEDYRENTRGEFVNFLPQDPQWWALTGHNRLKADIEFEDFTWEARGLRAAAATLRMRAFEQKGKFQTIAGKEAPVYFPVPYESPPNVELSGTRSGSVLVAECTPKYFRWKHAGPSGTQYEGEVEWIARGIKAAEVPK